MDGCSVTGARTINNNNLMTASELQSSLWQCCLRKKNQI